MLALVLHAHAMCSRVFCYLQRFLWRHASQCVCSADRDVFAFDWLGMGASARPAFEAADQEAAESFFLEVW